MILGNFKIIDQRDEKNKHWHWGMEQVLVLKSVRIQQKPGRTGAGWISQCSDKKKTAECNLILFGYHNLNAVISFYYLSF